MHAIFAPKRKYPSIWKILLWCAVGAVVWALLYVFILPDVRPLKKQNPKTTAFIELRRKQAAKAGKKFNLRMQWTPIENISPDLVHAVIVAEDQGFYRHHGIEWELTKEALIKDIKRMKFAAGASTITQQLARNLYLSPSKNPLRKVKEFLIAKRLEKELGKRRILELYLNVAEWGKGVFGIGAAAEGYFGQSAASLDPEEASALASILPSPRKWSPLAKGTYASRRAQDIVRRMRASGYIDDDDDAPTAPTKSSSSESGPSKTPTTIITPTSSTAPSTK